MSTVDPNMIISASEMFKFGQSNPQGLRLILQYLQYVDAATYETVLGNVRYGLEYSQIYREPDSMRSLLGYLRPLVDRYNQTLASGGQIPRCLQVARTLADDIVNLNRYANFRGLVGQPLAEDLRYLTDAGSIVKNPDQGLVRLFQDLRTSVTRSHLEMERVVRQSSSYRSTATNVYHNVMANGRMWMTRASQFASRVNASIPVSVKQKAAAAGTFVASSWHYVAGVATTTVEVGAVATTAAFTSAVAIGAGLGAGWYYSGLGEWSGSDDAACTLGDWLFESTHREEFSLPEGKVHILPEKPKKSGLPRWYDSFMYDKFSYM